MKKNIVLVVDAGGRGAALAHKYSLSPCVSKVIAIPGNDLMRINSSIPVETYQQLKTTSIREILEICKKEKVDIVDVAQDNAVAVGLVDELNKAGINTIGPTKSAGQIEWDKAWAREFMKKYKIPHPKFKICKSQKEGINFVKKHKSSWFVKASGLAEGKGAIPASNTSEAIEAIEQMRRFGSAGKIYLLEEWLIGEEFSAFALADGKDYQIVGFAKDYKRLYDGDLGENTGGIGSVSNPLKVNKKIEKQAESIMNKALNGLRKEERPYKGVLYLGGIVVKGKVYVIEFNARWGDPEAEVLIPGIKNDLFKLSMSIVEGNLKKFKVKVDGKSRVAVTGLLRPGAAIKKRELFGINKILKFKKVIVYGARVTKVKDRYFVSSGRLFHVVGEGKNVIEARKKAYEAIELINIEGNNLHFRTDIGWRDVERLRGFRRDR